MLSPFSPQNSLIDLGYDYSLHKLTPSNFDVSSCYSDEKNAIMCGGIRCGLATKEACKGGPYDRDSRTVVAGGSRRRRRHARALARELSSLPIALGSRSGWSAATRESRCIRHRPRDVSRCAPQLSAIPWYERSPVHLLVAPDPGGEIGDDAAPLPGNARQRRAPRARDRKRTRSIFGDAGPRTRGGAVVAKPSGGEARAGGNSVRRA